MELISSPKNDRIAFLRKLQKKKYRRQENKFIIENYKTILDAAVAGFIFDELYVSSTFLEEQDELFRALYQYGERSNYFQITTRVLEAVSQLKTPSGVIAVYRKKDAKFRMSTPVLYLNGINDPGNLGTILRTALAFSFRDIVVDAACADVYNYKTINASKDAIFKVTITHDTDGAIFDALHDAMPIYATHTSTGGVSAEQIAENTPYCIVFGNEAHGVSDDILQRSAGFLHVETSRDIESLNVASTVAIILHDLYQASQK